MWRRSRTLRVALTVVCVCVCETSPEQLAEITFALRTLRIDVMLPINPIIVDWNRSFRHNRSCLAQQLVPMVTQGHIQFPAFDVDRDPVGGQLRVHPVHPGIGTDRFWELGLFSICSGRQRGQFRVLLRVIVFEWSTRFRRGILVRCKGLNGSKRQPPITCEPDRPRPLSRDIRLLGGHVHKIRKTFGG